MPIPKINLSFNRRSDSDLLTDSQGILASLTGNTRFPTPMPPLPEFTTGINDFLLAMADAQGRDVEKVAMRNDKRFTLEALLLKLGNYVTLTADGDLTALISSGFPLAKQGSPTPPIQTPQDLRVENGLNSGEVVTSVKGVKGAKSYLHQYTKGPITENSVWISLSCTTRKCTIADLEPGEHYWFRIAAVGVRGQIVYSDVLERIIQ